ncbi:MAG: hypothetical protein KJ006_13190 [Thermoleophilia bacterium]|nr:hypothetical protein [Thermoleophilia bacterium]
MDPQQKRDEQHSRQVEKALLHIDDTARQVGRIANSLADDGGDPGLVAALREAAGRVRGEHRELMKRVYFRAPDDEQQSFVAEPGQQRLAS